jgi:hypothetical protein
VAARAPTSAFFGFALGALQLGIGGLLVVWAWVAHLYPARGFDGVQWLVESSPLPWSGSPAQIANMAVQDEVVWASGFAGIVLAVFALATLRGARLNLLPANASANGKFRLDLEAPPRIGCWLEGKIVLLKGGKAGEPYSVSVRCTREVLDYRASDRDDMDRESYYRTEVKYDQRMHSKAVPGASGLAVPFRFEIPTHMPEEGPGGFRSRTQFHWKIEVGKRDSVFISKFPLDVKRLGRGESGKGVGDLSALPRNWTYVEPTRREAILRGAVEKHALRVVLGLIGVIIVGSVGCSAISALLE